MQSSTPRFLVNKETINMLHNVQMQRPCPACKCKQAAHQRQPSQLACKQYLSCCTAIVAVHDDQGELLGELGASTPSVVMALPLPLYACWAHVLLTASHLQHWEVAKRAAAVLLPRFIATSPSRPLWQAHPMDRHQLQMQQVQGASPALLRLLVQAVYVFAQHMGEQQQLLLQQRPAAAGASGDGAAGASGLAGTAASRALLLQLSGSQVPQQVALLESSKKLMAAMQVRV
jgi:hypothetical protein